MASVTGMLSGGSGSRLDGMAIGCRGPAAGPLPPPPVAVPSPRLGGGIRMASVTGMLPGGSDSRKDGMAIGF